MRKRTLYSLLLMLALIVALIAAVWLRKHAPPEVARLLPESDAIVYFNLRPLRTATHFERAPVLTRSIKDALDMEESYARAFAGSTITSGKQAILPADAAKLMSSYLSSSLKSGDLNVFSSMLENNWIKSRDILFQPSLHGP